MPTFELGWNLGAGGGRGHWVLLWVATGIQNKPNLAFCNGICFIMYTKVS